MSDKKSREYDYHRFREPKAPLPGSDGRRRKNPRRPPESVVLRSLDANTIPTGGKSQRW